MDKSIYYYKNASSLNHSKAKNNLAMIYAHRIVVEKNERYVKQYAIELLKESIKLKDRISMYNLAHFYFYNEDETYNIETIIDYLIKSSNNVISSMELLSLILVKKLKTITYNSIENELKTNKTINCDQIENLASDIFIFIEENNLTDPKNYDNLYSQLKNDDYVYDWNYDIVCTNSFFAEKKREIPRTCKIIDKNFYEGFGITLT